MIFTSFLQVGLPAVDRQLKPSWPREGQAEADPRLSSAAHIWSCRAESKRESCAETCVSLDTLIGQKTFVKHTILEFLEQSP